MSLRPFLSLPYLVCAMLGVFGHLHAQASTKTQFLGIWYEIATTKPFGACASGTMLTLGQAPGDGMAMMLDCVGDRNKFLHHSASLKLQGSKGMAWQTSNARQAPHASWNDMLNAGTEVLHMSNDANHMLLWHAASKQARILSRRPFLTDSELKPILSTLKPRGFEKSALSFTTHGVCSVPNAKR